MQNCLQSTLCRLQSHFLFLMAWDFVLHGDVRAALKKCVSSCGVRNIAPLVTGTEIGCPGKLCLGYILCQIAFSLVFVVVASGFLCILMLLKPITRNDAIVIIANIFG
jgi:hypothetical protein